MSKVMRYLVCFLILVTVCMPVITVTATDSPDLEAANIGVTALYAGVANKVTVTVNNKTNVAVPNFDVKLQANGDDVATMSGNYVAGNQDQYYWPAVVNFQWTPLATGSYTLTAIVDSAGTVVETNETNNTVQRAVDVVVLAPVTVKVRVEGKNSTIWSGQVTFQDSSITDKEGVNYSVDHPTALGALDAANQVGLFNYVVNSGYGPLSFVEGIAGETNAGMDGWQYRVNWLSPDVGAVDYSVKAGDEVLWYYGGYDLITWAPTSPLRLTLDKHQLTTAQTLTATVEAFNGISWAIVSGAMVNVGAQQHTTDADGQVKNLSLGTGSYTLYASKGTWSEYVRSNMETVAVSQAPVPLAGDANGDGDIDAADITVVERIIAGLDIATPGADANQDGHINALDITKVERIFAGLN